MIGHHVSLDMRKVGPINEEKMQPKVCFSFYLMESLKTQHFSQKKKILDLYRLKMKWGAKQIITPTPENRPNMPLIKED